MNNRSAMPSQPGADRFVASPSNSNLKEVAGLRVRSVREQAGLFIIEGGREIGMALAAGHPIKTLYAREDLFGGSDQAVLIERCRAAGAEIVCCSERAISRISYGERADGLVAVAPIIRLSLADLAPANPALLVVAVSVEKPGNIGALARCADAAAAHGLILCDASADAHNPNVVRASAGLVFAVPIIAAPGSETIAWLKARGIAIIAATPHAQTHYDKADMCRPVAITVGAEDKGLSTEWLEQAEMRVSIPMRGSGDSLNVAVAAGVILFEAVRQRSSSA